MEKRTYLKSELVEVLALLGFSDVDEGSIETFVSEEDQTPYSAWLIRRPDRNLVLKVAKDIEMEIYRHFFVGIKPYVPTFLGSCQHGGETFFLMEYCPGKDMRHADHQRLVKTLDALIAMQDEFWGREDLGAHGITMERALKAIEDRGKYLGSETLEKAYRDFATIYRSTPRTLCHEDLLPINVLANDDRAVLIDWECGGILPYLSSFSRLIAHVKDDENYYFYMAAEDRDFAIEYYYEHLVSKHGISYERYRHDLDYFLFFEYCEWIMLGNRYDGRSDERFSYYSKLALDLAKELKP